MASACDVQVVQGRPHQTSTLAARPTKVHMSSVGSHCGVAMQNADVERCRHVIANNAAPGLWSLDGQPRTTSGAAEWFEQVCALVGATRVGHH